MLWPPQISPVCLQLLTLVLPGQGELCLAEPHLPRLQTEQFQSCNI